MPLQTYITTEAKANLDHFTYNKDAAEMIVSAASGATLRLQAPFKMTKIPDRVFDTTLDIAKVFIFRNLYFKEKSVIKLKYKVGDENKNCGFIFSLRGITQPDDVIEDAKDIALYATSAFMGLIHNKSSLPAKIPDINPSGEYELSDFFDDDIVICVISKEQVGGYSNTVELSILYQLNLFGFYLLNSDQNRGFQPEINKYQRNALNSILRHDNTGKLIIQNLSEKVISEPYFENYITRIINTTQNFIAKFFLIYQCYEILIDHVTKAEISTKVGALGAMDNKSGYTIKGMVMEIGDEGYRIEKLFNYYSSFSFESDYHIGFEIDEYFSNYKVNYESKPNVPYGGYFYDLRNTIVHNLRMCYAGTPEEINKKLQDLELLITHIEFLAIETILGLKI
jgi:hypothetical protein